ncbi:MAG: TetR/AcrR family transcriptional regulator [Reyranella sp.]
MELPSTPPPGPARVDGRRLRSMRTRQLVIEAYLALLRDNPAIPTAAQVAEQAGYSVRSIFERFPDLHALRIAATDYAFSLANNQSATTGFEGDRQTRIKLHVEMRAHICAQWLPLWRALIANKGESKELEMRIQAIRGVIVNRIELMYRPELSTLGEPERRQTVLAIDALIDFESWARMHEFFGLSFEEGCTVWIRAIDRLLPPTPPDS